MITVFLFSNQPAVDSADTSTGVTETIINFFTHNSLSEEEKVELLGKLHPIIRKLAHYTLYTIGGFLIINYINTYDNSEKRKIIYSICIGIIYACTDEFHQLFVEGRGGQIRDVLIDSLGVITGVCIFLCIKKQRGKLQ